MDAGITLILFDATSLMEPLRISLRIYLVFLETNIIGLHFAAGSMRLSLFNFFSGGLSKTFFNFYIIFIYFMYLFYLFLFSARVTFRPFKVIQGH